MVGGKLLPSALLLRSYWGHIGQENRALTHQMNAERFRSHKYVKSLPSLYFIMKPKESPDWICAIGLRAHNRKA